MYTLGQLLEYVLKINVPFPVPYYSSNPPINFQEYEGKYSYQVWRFK